jgi:single-strand DNA-binding protein
MPSFNKITILGHLGRDVETRYLPDGTAVASFSVATSEKRKDRNGDYQETTTWFRCTVFGKQAELCGQYLSKGSQVYVEGKLSQNEYTDKDGNKRTSLEVKATDVQFLDRKPQGDARPADELEGARQHTERKTRAVNLDENDSSIPF